jgi:hypothetical protein
VFVVNSERSCLSVLQLNEISKVNCDESHSQVRAD